MATKTTLVGLCPACGQNLDNGGNFDCPTCAAEPTMVETFHFDRDLIVVVVSGDPDGGDPALEDYLLERFPDHRPISTASGFIFAHGESKVALLDLNIGG